MIEPCTDRVFVVVPAVLEDWAPSRRKHDGVLVELDQRDRAELGPVLLLGPPVDQLPDLLNGHSQEGQRQCHELGFGTFFHVWIPGVGMTLLTVYS